jgi:hypothetical protein
VQISRTLDSLLDENGQDSESDETGLQRVARSRNSRYYDEGLEVNNLFCCIFLLESYF